ncbi:hypothetical protein Tco_0482576 [Tanacetum coccineum]
MYKEYLAEFWYSAKTLENSKVFFSTPTGGIYGEVGVNTFRNAIGAHYLPHSSEYVAPPSIDIVRPWFETIGYGEAVPDKRTLKKVFFLLGGANGINIDYASIFWEDIIIKLNKKHREKVVPYTRFLSLLMMHKMKEGYGDGELTLYPTQVFSVNNWALKPNQPEEPPFTTHMLAICSADKPVAFKAPKPSSNVERVPQGTKPGAKPGHKKHSTSSKQPSVIWPLDQDLRATLSFLVCTPDGVLLEYAMKGGTMQQILVDSNIERLLLFREGVTVTARDSEPSSVSSG